MFLRNEYSYLDIAIKNAITNKHFVSFKKIYEAMQATNDTLAQELDENNKSYFFLALETGADEIANHLANHLLPQHLFAVDNQQRTLLHMAAQKGCLRIIEMLIEIAEQKEKIKDYLAKDQSGSTVMHYASMNPAPEQNQIFELLFSTIKKYTDTSTYVNQFNVDGNTALHLAMIHSPGNVVNLLMNAGAKLNTYNNNKETAFQLFSNMTIEKQVAIFRNLSEENRKIIFQYYGNLHNEILQSDDDNRIKEIEKNRLTLAANISLEFLADFFIKHHSHAVSFQSFTKRPLHKQMTMLLILDKENQDSFLTSYENLFEETLKSDEKEKAEEIANNILTLAYQINPLFFADFCHKHGFDEDNKDIIAAITEINKKIELEKDKVVEIPAYESMGADRQRIASLLSELEAYLQILNDKPEHEYATLKAVAYPMMSLTAYMLLVFTPIETFFAEMEAATSMYNSDGSWNTTKFGLYSTQHAIYSSVELSFGIFGSFIPTAAALLYIYSLYNAPLPTSVSHHEWKPLIDSLKKYLDGYEKKNLEHEDNTATQNLQTLNDHIDNLTENNHFFTLPFLNWKIDYPRASLPTLQDSFTQIIESVKNLQKDITVFSSSITFFSESRKQENGDVILDIYDPEDEKRVVNDPDMNSDEDAEELELLKRYVV